MNIKAIATAITASALIIGGFGFKMINQAYADSADNIAPSVTPLELAMAQNKCHIVVPDEGDKSLDCTISSSFNFLGVRYYTLKMDGFQTFTAYFYKDMTADMIAGSDGARLTGTWQADGSKLSFTHAFSQNVVSIPMTLIDEAEDNTGL